MSYRLRTLRIHRTQAERKDDKPKICARAVANSTAADEIQTAKAGAYGGNSSFVGGEKAAAGGTPTATRAAKARGELADTRVGTTAVGVAILIGDPDVRRHSLQHG
jgi:hypothetical protein